MTTKRKTYNITEERQLRLERLAIEISGKTGKAVRWTELLTFLIDAYAKEAAEDMKNEAPQNKKA